PGRAFRRIAELLESIGEQRAGRLIIRLGEYQVTYRLRDKAEFAFDEIPARPRQDRLAAAHILDIFLAGLDRRQRIKIDRVGVIPAEIFLVDRFHVVPDVAVIASAVPGALQACGQTE